MSQETNSAKILPPSNPSGATASSYTLGFVSSILLTALAYYIVVSEAFGSGVLIFWLAILALAQLIVQLWFFLHLGAESKPRWNFMVFLFMLMVLVIVVFGSIWIMNNLHYTTMSPEQTETLLLQNEALER